MPAQAKFFQAAAKMFVKRRDPISRIKCPACLLAWFLYLSASISASAQFTSGDANIIFNAYTNAFYVSSGQNTYFQNTQTGGGYTTFWEETEEIECVIDTYEWTSNATYKTMITNLLNGFTSDHGTDWTSVDGYNDDVMWAVMTFARGGMDTGMTNFCNIALSNYTNCYARAWSTNDGGGLWWEYPEDGTKNACVNGPGAIAAYLMYEIYGNTNYWNESSNIYFWERSVLYNGAGKIYDHVSITNNVDTLNTVATTYNQGTFIGAANFLGQTNDAIAAANYTKNSMGSGGILPEYGIENNNSGFNAIFIRWMARFMKNNGLQSTYQAWLQTNANAAWNFRRTSDNLSWCQWLEQTPASTNLYSWDCISSLEALQAVPPTEITIVTNLPLQVTLVSGSSYAYSIGVSSPAPVGHQWYNVTTPLSGQTNATYTVTAGSVGSRTTYDVVITNIYGAITSTVSTFTSIAQLTTHYATNLLQFNPVGYWPMHEVEAAARGDIETNYGSLGLLGTGYYPDWAPSPAVSILRQHAGPFPNSAFGNNTNMSVSFTHYMDSGSPEFTNGLFIPHTSPLTTLNPPFTVECWCYPTNIGPGVPVWSQTGDEGLNAGAEGGDGGYVTGIFLNWAQGGFVGYVLDDTLNGGFGNSQKIGGGSGGTETLGSNNWWYVVLTCDPNTNMIYWTNGVECQGTHPEAGDFSPDYWTPLSIACGLGNTKALAGNISEFAVYTNVLTTNDIAAHYNDGLNDGASQYFADVMASNPAIYFRMNSPAYSPPPASTWPALTNYGNAGASGVYSPGTMPGIAPAPTTTSGAPFVGLSGTNVASLSGVSSFADVGFAAAYDPIGAVPFTITAMFRGNPCDNRIQTIVGHGINSWGIVMNTNGTLQCQLGTNSSSLVNSAGVYNDGNWHQVVDVYTPASNPNLTGNNALYVDGVLDTAISTVNTNGILPGTSEDMMIGADPDYTNSPPGAGRQFAGQVCEVALFTNALTAAQVQQLYNATIPVTVNPNPTNILFSVTGNQLTLSWPADHIGWTLQAQTNGLSVGISTNWVNVGGSISTNQVVIPINLTNGSVFYRLMYTP